MLSDTLKAFSKAYDELWLDLREMDTKQKINDLCLSAADISLLEDLLKKKLFHLKAFEILLHVAPDKALNFIKNWYLSLDLSNNAKDHVADLEIMFSDIKEILGEDKLEELLNSPDFLPENKKNPRVIEAIAFAKDED